MKYLGDENLRILLEELKAEQSISELCWCDGIIENSQSHWSIDPAADNSTHRDSDKGINNAVQAARVTTRRLTTDPGIDSGPTVEGLGRLSVMGRSFHASL